jgi:phosphoglycolate phosphatase
MNQENKKLIIFDFDGVLANTEEFCYKIHKEFNKDLTWEKWQDFCNGNFIDGIEDTSKNDIFVNRSDFGEKYQEEIQKIKVNDVLNKTITELFKDYILVITSSTDTDYINDFLEKENLRKYFSDILGADVHRNKTIKINSFLKKYSTLSENAVFVTDSLGDILEANKCGVRSIGVTWGIHGHDNLKKGNPVTIIDDPNDLLNTVDNVLK